MHYIIDGYNLFFWEEDVCHPIEKKRNDFIHSLNQRFERECLKATLIFDGHKTLAHFFPSTYKLSSIEVIFSPKNLTADDYILEYFKLQKQPQDIVIVTSDLELSQRAKRLGAKTKTVESFLKILLKRKSKRDKEKNEKKQVIETTAQFERLLKAFEDKLKE